MAFQTGTATDAENLLALFRTFITSHADLLDPAGDGSLPSQVWVEEDYRATTDGNGNNHYELYLRGPGLGASDNIFVSTQLFNDTTAGLDAWSWRSYGHTSFDTNQSYDNQPGSSQNGKIMPLFDASTQYWFFANGRRYMIFAQVTASVYSSCYCGFILPFSPSVAALEYTYPLFIGANMGTTQRRFSDTSNAVNTAFWDPGQATTDVGSSIIYGPDNVWTELYNTNTTGTPEISVTSLETTFDGMIEPYHRTSRIALPDLSIENIEPLLGGDYVLTDCTIVRPHSDQGRRERFGVLDGVAHISGFSQSSQNTVTVGSDTYIIFQKSFRTGAGDFAAILQE